MTKDCFRRDRDGILIWIGGDYYAEPDEAIKTVYNGKSRLICTAAKYGSWSRSPCGLGAKHDPDRNGNPTRCGNHSAEAVAKRLALQQERNEQYRVLSDARKAVRSAEADLEKVLRLIADGHNDSRTLAAAAVSDLDLKRDHLRSLEHD
jgi:hypothetical protein